MDPEDKIQIEWKLEEFRDEREWWEWRVPGGRKVGPGPHSDQRDGDLYGIHIDEDRGVYHD